MGGGNITLDIRGRPKRAGKTILTSSMCCVMSSYTVEIQKVEKRDSNYVRANANYQNRIFTSVLQSESCRHPLTYSFDDRHR